MSGARVYTLDVIRGIAASLVVVHHVLRCVPGLNDVHFWSSSASNVFWVRYAFLGDLAVTVFFVLSGASLALSALEAEYHLTAWKFLIKRFFRIYPLYIGTIFVYFLFRPVYSYLISSPFPKDWLSPQFLYPVDIRTWFVYGTMIFNYFDGPSVFNNALWSLPIEFQFYIFFPLFILFYRISSRLRANLFVFFVGCIALLFSVLVSSRGGMLGRLWEFIGGVVIAINYSETSRKNLKWGGAWLLAAIFFFIANRGGLYVDLPVIPSNYLDVLFSFSILGFALAMRDWKPATKTGKIFVRIGEISYSVYLGHMIWLGLFAPLLYKLNIEPWLLGLILFLIVYPATLAMSNFIFDHYEKPFINMGRTLIWKLDKTQNRRSENKI